MGERLRIKTNTVDEVRWKNVNFFFEKAYCLNSTKLRDLQFELLHIKEKDRNKWIFA